jgi:hypothetical protein
MPAREETAIHFDAIEFRGQSPYTHIKVSVHWDDGEQSLGAGRVTFDLPIPREAAQDISALRESALALIRSALDTNALRTWRGAPHQSK